MRKAIDWAEVKNRMAHAQSALEQSLRPDATRLAKVFKDRAERFAQPRGGVADVSGELHTLEFHLGSERFLIELSEIAEILPMPIVTLVPNAPEGLFGVFNLGGEIVPLIDLAAVLGLAPLPDGAACYVLMLRHAMPEAGLRVGPIDQVRNFSANEILPVEEIASERARRFFKGITKDSTFLLNFETIQTHTVFQCR